MSRSRWLQLTLVVVAVAGVVVVATGRDREPASVATNPLVGATGTAPTTGPTTTTRPRVDVYPGMPAVVDPTNVYSETAAGRLIPSVADDLPRIYVPNRAAGTVTVIDPATKQVIETYPTGRDPHHVVPSWDLQTLWVTNTAEGRTDGSMTPIDPDTGKPGASIAVDDPYNLYFTPDGASAIVVAEAFQRLDFRDPKTLALQSSLPVPMCAGVNHADFTIDGRFMILSCEFQGSMIKVDVANRTVVGTIALSGGGMPQDTRLAPDGRTVYVAELTRGGLYTIDPDAFVETGFHPIGVGTHAIYPSRDGNHLYVANRGIGRVGGPPRGKGSVTKFDWRTNTIVTDWPIPGGGSPDMGGITADGSEIWLGGRYDNVVYALDLGTGTYTIVPVGIEPHGLTVWPQPGRYSLGHTANIR